MKNSNKDKNCDLIVQHNELIEARQFFTLQEKRIIYWLSAQVDIQDEDFKEHHLGIREFCELVDIKHDGMYNRLANVTKGLMKKVIEIRTIKDSKEILEQVHLLSYARYEEGFGAVALSFHPHMKRFLLNLKDNFTKTSLSIALKFSSIYSLRFYELMKRELFLSMSILKLSELKLLLGIQDGKYTNYKDFRRRILEPAINEVNKKSDMQIDWFEIKDGKKVEFIKFSIKEELQDKKKCSSLFKKDGIINQHILDVLRKEFSEDIVQQGVEVLRLYKGEIKNPVLFLKKAIKEGWQPFQDMKPQDPSKDLAAEIQLEIFALDEDPICLQIRKLFLERNGAAEYRSWIQPLSLQLADDCVVIVAKSVFTKDWLETNCAKQFTNYADGRKIVFRTDEKDDNSHQHTATKAQMSGPKKGSGKKSVRKAKAYNADVSIQTVIDVNEKQDLTVTETVQEQPAPAVNKKSLWERIKSFWK